MKKLHKSTEHKIISGILGGIGEYYQVDPTMIRLWFVGLTMMSGLMPGIVTYIAAVFLVSKKA